MTTQKIYGRPLNFKTRRAQALRKNVYERDKYSCCGCGKTAINIPTKYNGENTLYCNDGWLELDHNIPRFHGGLNEMDNLKTMCNKCNARKGFK